MLKTYNFNSSTSNLGKSKVYSPKWVEEQKKKQEETIKIPKWQDMGINIGTAGAISSPSTKTLPGITGNQTKTQTGTSKSTTTVPLPSITGPAIKSTGTTDSRRTFGGITFNPELKPITTQKPSTTPLIATPPKTENQTKTGGMPLTITYGRSAKKRMNRIYSVTENNPFKKNVFEDIDEKDIEKNLPLAESTIKSNVERGLLPKDYEKKFPYMKDGFAVSYAADDENNRKAANAARNIAYMEGIPGVEELKKPLETTDYKNSLNEFKNINQVKNKNIFSDIKDNASTIFENIIGNTIFADTKDLVENIKEKDFYSAFSDFLRIVPGADALPTLGKYGAKLVWKLGADLYLRKGKKYTVSADLLEHALNENPKDLVFNDDSDIAKKMKADTGFMDKIDEYIYKVENNIKTSDQDKQYQFESNKNADLYYSIHGCSFEIADVKYNEDGTKDIIIHASDAYDFTQIWTYMGEKNEFDKSRVGLGTIANDAGTITTKLDALNPYNVDVYFTIRR